MPFSAALVRSGLLALHPGQEGQPHPRVGHVLEGELDEHGRLSLLATMANEVYTGNIHFRSRGN